MAFVIADRIKETSTTTGTGTLTLAGAVTGFRTFASVGNANTTTYLIVVVDANGVPTGEWETGIGTYTSSGTTLSRGFIASSTGSAVSFAAGTKHVICTDVAGYATPLVMATTANREIQVANQTALSSTAGNARGKAAVDLLIRRTSATEVASGAYSVSVGGRRNTASSAYSTVMGGDTNTASGNCSLVIGGRSNTASNSFSAVLCGYNVTVSSQFAVSVGGRYNTIAHNYVTAFGVGAVSNRTWQTIQAAGALAAHGDVQSCQQVLSVQTTNATQTELKSNGSGRLTLSNDSTWAFEIIVVARRTNADNESAGYTFTGVIDRNANAASTAIVGTVTKVVLAEDTAAWDVTVDADTTNGSLRIRVTGESAKTIHWVAFARTVETFG